MVGTARFARSLASSLVLSIVAVAVVVAAAPAGAAPKTYRPTRFGDPAPGPCKPKDCSLREAVRAANANPGRDTIILRRGTYKLTRDGIDDDAMVGDLDVRDHILIRGDGGRAKIRQTVADRVFDLDPTNIAMGLRMTFRDVAIRGGRVTGALDDGGGILASNDERVTLRNVVVAGNRVEGNGGEGGGIYAYQARLTIVQSVIRGNFAGDTGGGVDTEGTTTIRKSTIAGNIADSNSGGVENLGTMRIESSTISGNRAIVNYGGGIWNQSELTVRNSTISGNRAGQHGGGVAGQTDGPGEFTSLVNSTVARNRADPGHVNLGDGGGVFSFAGVVRLTNTIVGDNVDGSPAAGINHDDCSTQGDAIILKGRNLIEKVAGCARTGAVGKLIKKDPKLKALRSNGGPTRTHALKQGSRAIGRATKKLAPKRDQRGVLRDGKPDLGAYERT
ncbi:MAG TPA: right-handed parallel beta-helix repeat-containing protein [Actinomycetota bacterium]